MAITFIEMPSLEQNSSTEIAHNHFVADSLSLQCTNVTIRINSIGNVFSGCKHQYNYVSYGRLQSTALAFSLFQLTGQSFIANTLSDIFSALNACASPDQRITAFKRLECLKNSTRSLNLCIAVNYAVNLDAIRAVDSFLCRQSQVHCKFYQKALHEQHMISYFPDFVQLNASIWQFFRVL